LEQEAPVASKSTRHLQYVISELSRYDDILSAPDLAEATALLTRLSIDPASDLEGHLILLTRQYVASNGLHALYKGAAEAAEVDADVVEARADVAIRGIPTQDKLTEAKIAQQVKLDPGVQNAKKRAIRVQELADIFYGLREALRMRFTAVEHMSNNRRAQMKVES